MESYCKNLIWATTIPGGPALDRRKKENDQYNLENEIPKVFLADAMDNWNADVRRYNEAVVPMLRERGIIIDDHFAALDGKTDRYISEDGIHPNADGFELLAQLTAREIQKLL
jgi:lysophospholipase L1-like esterase